MEYFLSLYIYGSCSSFAVVLFIIYISFLQFLCVKGHVFKEKREDILF
jgi:hypothetical protein